MKNELFTYAEHAHYLSMVLNGVPSRFLSEFYRLSEILEGDEDEIRTIYLTNVLKWGLPIDSKMMAFTKGFLAEFLSHFPQCANVDYLQGA